MAIRRWLSLLAGTSILLAATSPARAQLPALEFGAIRPISGTPDRSADPRMHLVRDGSLVVVWREGTVIDAHVAMRRSTDGGETFSPVKRVSSTPGPTYFPSVASDRLGNLFVVWREPLFPQGDVYFSRSTDAGGNFSAGKNVSNTEGSTAMAGIAADDNGVLAVVWDDNGQVAFSQSFDMGETFSERISLTGEDGFAVEPAVAAQGPGEVVVAWTELIDDFFQVMFARSFDAGNTFSLPRNLSRSTEDASQPRVQIGPDGGLYAVYGQRDEEGELLVAFRRSWRRFVLGGGERFGPTQLLGFGGAPDLFVDERGRVYVVWSDLGEVYFSYSLPGGALFSSPVNLSQTPGPPVPNAPGYSSNPSVVVGAHGVCVAWQEVLPDGNQEIVLRRAAR